MRLVQACALCGLARACYVGYRILTVTNWLLQAQFGEEAVKPAKPEKVVGDVNAIPLGQRPQQEKKKPAVELEPIPDVEWWDARLLRNPKVSADTEQAA